MRAFRSGKAAILLSFGMATAMLSSACGPLQVNPASADNPLPTAAVVILTPAPTPQRVQAVMTAAAAPTSTPPKSGTADKPTWWGETPRASLDGLLKVYQRYFGAVTGWIQISADYYYNSDYFKGGPQLSDGTILSGGAHYETYALINATGTADQEVTAIRRQAQGDLLDTKACSAAKCQSSLSGVSATTLGSQNAARYFVDWDPNQYVIHEAAWQAQVAADTSGIFKNVRLAQTQTITKLEDGRQVLAITQDQTFDPVRFSSERKLETVATRTVHYFDVSNGYFAGSDSFETFTDGTTALTNSSRFSVVVDATLPSDVSQVVTSMEDQK